MKKFITLTLALILTLTFAACGGNNSGTSQNKPADTQTSTQTEPPVTKQSSGNIDPKLIGKWEYLYNYYYLNF